VAMGVGKIKSDIWCNASFAIPLLHFGMKEGRAGHVKVDRTERQMQVRCSLELGVIRLQGK
jgi:hypothetical protein